MNFDKNNIDLIVNDFVSSKILDRGITSNTTIAYIKDLNLFITWGLNTELVFLKLIKKV